jgi:hypothetical protein
VTLGPPISAVSTVALTSILTNAPFPTAGVTGCFRLTDKIVTSGVAVMKQLIRIRRVRTRFTWSLA